MVPVKFDLFFILKIASPIPKGSSLLFFSNTELMIYSIKMHTNMSVKNVPIMSDDNLKHGYLMLYF